MYLNTENLLKCAKFAGKVGKFFFPQYAGPVDFGLKLLG